MSEDYSKQDIRVARQLLIDGVDCLDMQFESPGRQPLRVGLSQNRRIQLLRDLLEELADPDTLLPRAIELRRMIMSLTTDPEECGDLSWQDAEKLRMQIESIT